MDRRSHAMLRTLLSYYNVSRGFGSVTKAPFTTTACLLSSISLEFNCSGWKLPESSKAEMMSMTHPPLPFYNHLESQTKDRQGALLSAQSLNFPENDYFYMPNISGILYTELCISHKTMRKLIMHRMKTFLKFAKKQMAGNKHGISILL